MGHLRRWEWPHNLGAPFPRGEKLSYTVRLLVQSVELLVSNLCCRNSTPKFVLPFSNCMELLVCARQHRQCGFREMQTANPRSNKQAVTSVLTHLHGVGNAASCLLFLCPHLSRLEFLTCVCVCVCVCVCERERWTPLALWSQQTSVHNYVFKCIKYIRLQRKPLYWAIVIKNTFKEVKVKVAQLCLILCDPMDYTVQGILQARILVWVAFPVYIF